MFGQVLRRQSGQASPEWLGLLLVVALLLGVVLATLGSQLPGAALARAIAGRIVCAVKLSDSCDRAPELVAAYGDELASLVRRHAPQIAYEAGMRALPVDYRRCRSPQCADGPEAGLVARSGAGRRVVAFVHVVDCRVGEPPPFAGRNTAADCSGPRRGNLYLQYWLYYPNSATFRGVPVAGAKGFHVDDWEGYQVRIGMDGAVDARASSHNGYNYRLGHANWASDAGWGALRDATEAVGLRARNGWGPETGWLYVAGGSHAGSAGLDRPVSRVTFGHRLRLIPLEPVAAGERIPPAFAVTPPWRKRVWRDPEAEGTD
ncbi:MAG: hypothetical protein AABM29_04315 [Actinomycetota bacterium]